MSPFLASRRSIKSPLVMAGELGISLSSSDQDALPRVTLPESAHPTLTEPGGGWVGGPAGFLKVFEVVRDGK
jgi:hypothetical protein